MRWRHLTGRVNLLPCGRDLLSCGNKILFCFINLLTCGNSLLTFNAKKLSEKVFLILNDIVISFLGTFMFFSRG